MATADEYAAWIVANKAKRGTPEFDIVAKAYEQAKGDAAPQQAPQPHTESVASKVMEFGGDVLRNAKELGTQVGMGALKGASDIGATLMRPVDAALNATGLTDTTNKERRESLGGFFKENADPDSIAFKGGELATNVAGTAGVGGVLAKIPVIANIAPRLAMALKSGGFSIGKASPTVAGKAADWATRIGAGTAVGGASAGLIDPDNAGTGAVIGGVFPVAVKAAGAAGSALGAKVSPEVSALYRKAKDIYKIDIPADRIVNSKPLNAAAASLNYVPFSGRAATEEKMFSQMNRALSRTFGQDSDNVTMALRKAAVKLGDQFDLTLNNNKVKVDPQFLDDLAQSLERASKELGSDGARIIGNQADEIISKVGAGDLIDGRAAYNIKRTLDQIGSRNSPEAFYARDLKKSLMSALERSLKPDDAAAFAKVRQQYGTMLDLENLAQNGAEGGISVARLANMKHIKNPELQDLADIAAQFLKSRESPHGAMQRVAMGALGVGAGTTFPTAAPILGGVVAGGRIANTALNSGFVRDLVAAPAKTLGGNAPLRALLYSTPNHLDSP
jgi:hypothetical protein